jgi:hypothetical protein
MINFFLSFRAIGGGPHPLLHVEKANVEKDIVASNGALECM